jgi:hypothetical protein
MKVDFAVACDYALVDQYGKLSVLGIFQHIWVGQFPTVHPRLHLVIRLVDEGGGEVLSGDGVVTFNEPPAGVLEIEAGTVLAFDVPFAQPGRYQFEVGIDGQVATVVPISVSQAPTPPAPNPQQGQ